MKRLAFAAAALALAASAASAEWNSVVKDIGFGDKQSYAIGSGAGIALSFGCESSSQGISLKVLSSERATPDLRESAATIQVSIDGGPPIDFPARISTSAARTVLVTAPLNPASAKSTVEQFGAAKRNIAFRVALGYGIITRSEQVSASGSRMHMERALKGCLGSAAN